MRIFIDADSCPVLDVIGKIVEKKKIETHIVCDTNHIIERDWATTTVVSQGSDSADYAIANNIDAGDIIVTQDYGLAAMCLAKKAICISPFGKEYTNENIDMLLFTRYDSQKQRKAGVRLKGPKARKKDDNTNFMTEFIKIIEREN